MEAIKTITVETIVGAPLDKVWKNWSTPEDIVQWNSASEDWHTTRSENDLRAGGKFMARMEAKDGSFGFDFWGIYDEVRPRELIKYTLGDGRKVEVVFLAIGEGTKIVETFETENEYPAEHQRAGWQAILANFKKYTESD